MNDCNDDRVAHKLFLSLLVLGFIALNSVLAVRSWLLEDARLGWGMFSYQTNYSVSYEWVLRDGSVRPQPALDVAGRALKYVGDDAVHRTRYGLGGIRSWLDSYARYMHEEHRPLDAVAFRAVVDYVINKRGAHRRMVVQYPEEEDDPSS